MSSQEIQHPYELSRAHWLGGNSYGSDTTEKSPRNGFQYEHIRLEQDSPVEFAITKRYLAKYIPDGAVVADVGTGVGHYSEILAKRGCQVHLIDPAERLVAASRDRLVQAGVGQQILTMAAASATDLSFLPNKSCDAVLMLGPFYHLSQPEDRAAAASEAHRVLRKGGLLFAAGINVLTMPTWGWVDFPEEILDGYAEFMTDLLTTGNFPSPEPEVPPIINMTTTAGFRATFPQFEEVAMVGVESFANQDQDKLITLTPEQQERWLDFIEMTGLTPEGLGRTGHFLYIGRK